MKKAWPFSVYFFMYAGVAFLGPYLVLYYQERGFTGWQIGLLTGITPMVIFFSAPLWTRLADARNKHRLVMSVALLGSGIAVFFVPILNQFSYLILLIVLLYLFFGPINSFADSATMFMLGEKKELYGRVRVGGTISFGLAAPAAGVLVQNYGLKAAFWGAAVMLLLCLAASQKLVYGTPQTDESEKGGSILSILQNPFWLIFLFVAFAGGITSVAINLYLFPYMREMGANESIMGLALTFAVLSEIPIMIFGDRIIKRFGAYGMLMITMVITGVRMLLLAATGNYILVLVIQLLHGLTYPGMWVAGVSYADEIAPPKMSATAQGLFAAMVFGIGGAAGGFICGLLLESVGGRGLYLVVGVIELLIIAGAVIMQNIVKRNLVKDPPAQAAGLG